MKMKFSFLITSNVYTEFVFVYNIKIYNTNI